MKILISKYWNKFKKTIKDKNTGKTKKIRDGKKFEDLIQSILDLEYGKGKWHPTKTTHDGSRDFEWHTSSAYRWAECKNYEKTIGLEVLSNTLVMAIIDFADEIIIFSYSKVKKNVKKKLLQYAEASDKILYIFDDNSLEALILNHFKDLSLYFPDFDEKEIEKHCLYSDITCNIVSNPSDAYSLTSESGYISKKPRSVNTDSLICIEIYIHNCESKKKIYPIQLHFSKENCLELLEKKMGNQYISLSPGETCLKRIYMRIIKYKSRIKLPDITIEKNIFKFGTVKCFWNRECNLVGASYKKIQNEIESDVFIPGAFHAFMAYGGSGCGKHKLLEECKKIALKQGYRIIHFNQENFSDNIILNESENLSTNDEKLFYTILAEFICCIFDAPDLSSMLYESDEGIEQLSPVYQVLLHLKKNNCSKQSVEKIIPIISKKIMDIDCFIVLENIQFFPIQLIKVIHKIIIDLIHSNRTCKSRFAFSLNTDFLGYQDECIEFFINMKSQKTKILSRQISGFVNDGESEEFLLQLLPSNEIPKRCFEKLINKSERNPLFIRETLLMLENTGVILLADGSYRIPRSKTLEFIAEIETLPESVEEILERRWRFFCETQQKRVEDILCILSIVHVQRYINHEIILNYSLDEELINELQVAAFIKYDKKKNIWQFCYDSTEKYFADQYFPLCSYVTMKEIIPKKKYIWLNLIYKLSNINYILKKNENIMLKLPYHIAKEVYNLCIDSTAEIEDSNQMLQVFSIYHKIASNARELYGTRTSVDLFSKGILIINTYHQQLKERPEYVMLMVSYCNLLYEDKQPKKAYESMLEIYKIWNKKKVDNNIAIPLGYIYNRLHVYSRSLKKEVNQKNLYWLELSESISEQYDKAELKYINATDRGYCNYKDISTKSMLLAEWKKANTIFSDSFIPSKTLNDYFIRLCISIIEEQYDKALSISSEVIDYIEADGEWVYHRTYFKLRFLLGDIMVHLLKNDLTMYEIDEKIEQAEEYCFLLNSDHEIQICWLKSIMFYQEKNIEEAITCNNLAISLLEKDAKKTFANEYISQLKHNYAIFCNKKNIVSLPTSMIVAHKLNYPLL